MTNEQQQFASLYCHLIKLIIGQSALIERLIIALLVGGHILTEGAPGLAKTKAVKVLANCIQLPFKRIQFTADLLPSDLVGTDIYYANDSTFRFRKGPLFSNLILADEINRAPAKVQSALLEAMAEGQISSGGQTYSLPEIFIVMATQNPLDQEGIYSLPIAQLDRFLLNVQVTYPELEDEKRILRANRENNHTTVTTVYPNINYEEIIQARSQLLEMHMVPSIEEYIVQLVHATRCSKAQGSIARFLHCGVGPRATQALDRSARAVAWLKGRNYVTPEDVKAVAHDVLRHRLVLGINAVSENHSKDDLIKHALENITVC